MILFPNFFVQKGMSLTAFLVALTLFSGIFLAVSQWSSYQRYHSLRLYHHIQALQIADNQSQRQFLGLDCETEVQQNKQRFLIECKGQQVSVSSPFAEIRL